MKRGTTQVDTFFYVFRQTKGMTNLRKPIIALTLLLTLLLTSCGGQVSGKNDVSPSPFPTDSTPSVTPDETEIQLNAPVWFYRIYLSGQEEPSDLPIHKITSVEELVAISKIYTNSYYGYKSGEHELIDEMPSKTLSSEIFSNEEYNDAFFNESLLLFIPVGPNRGSTYQRFDSIKEVNGRMLVEYCHLVREESTDDEAYWMMVLEMDKQFAVLEVDVEFIIERI